MKKFFVTCLAGLLALCAAAQPDVPKTEDVKNLISQQKYTSAFEMLRTAKVITPEVIVSFSKLLTEHAIPANNKYTAWQLTDGPGGARTSQYNIPLEDLLWNAINKWPDDCSLYEEMCSFYAFIFRTEGEYTTTETLASISDEVQKSIQPKCPNYASYYVLGFANAQTGRSQQAFELLQKSVSLKPDFYDANLQLSRIYLQKKDYTNALANAKKAYALARKDFEYSDALLVSGQCYEALNDNAAALKYYLQADSLQRKNFFVLKSLLNFYVKTSNPKAAPTLHSFISSQGMASLHFYVDAYEIYAAHGRLADLAMYCQKRLAEYNGSAEFEACVNFTLGKIYQTINADMAKQYLQVAKNKGLNPNMYPETKNHPNTQKMIVETFKTL